MPLPLILGAAALIAGGVGVKKGLDAKENFDTAELIGRRAKRNHKEALESADAEREKTNNSLHSLGQLKVKIFSDQIKFLVDEIKKRKKAKSTLHGFKQSIDDLDLPQMERMVLNSLDIEKGLASGAASGALIGLGAYGSVGVLASASTGTAIASLSGAAATNATLAWLGGGSLAAGGFGMAGGMAVLGGLVAGPAIAITGFVMASKAEEALSKARDYESNVDQAIEKINSVTVALQGVQTNAQEMVITLDKLTEAFDKCKLSLSLNENSAFDRMFACGIALKNIMDTPIMEENGAAIDNFKSKLDTIIKTSSSGLLHYGD